MTAKFFVSLASRSNRSAEAFLQAYRDWITTGELSTQTSSILANVDNGSVSPDNGLEAIKNVALMHVLQETASKAERDLLNTSVESRSEKPISAVILTEDNVVATTTVNGEERELRANFDHIQEAERWCYNKLSSGGFEWTGKVTHHKIMIKNSPWVFDISREEALRALRKVTKTPFMHVNKVSGELKNKMKVNGKQAHFSHG